MFSLGSLIWCGGIIDSILFFMAAAAIAVITKKIWQRIRYPPPPKKTVINPNDYPRDKVVMFQMGPSAWCPSASPFVLKLQTYLRMADIPYMVVNGLDAASSKGKFPWILYRGEVVEDSSFIIDHLNRAAGIEETAAKLDPELRAIARAFQKLVEDELYWIVMLIRHGRGTTDAELMKLVGGITALDATRVRHSVLADAWAQGLGRHSIAQLLHIYNKDLMAISAILGKRPYLMGEMPSEVDTSLFGVLAQVRWQMPGSALEAQLKAEFPALVDYCDRIKDVFYPDWDKLHTHGGTREPCKSASP